MINTPSTEWKNWIIENWMGLFLQDGGTFLGVRTCTWWYDFCWINQLLGASRSVINVIFLRSRVSDLVHQALSYIHPMCAMLAILIPTFMTNKQLPDLDGIYKGKKEDDRTVAKKHENQVAQACPGPLFPTLLLRAYSPTAYHFLGVHMKRGCCNNRLTKTASNNVLTEGEKRFFRAVYQMNNYHRL